MATQRSNALNPAQRDVVEHGDGPCLVLAGAGSGKTRTIVHRVAHLLGQGVASQEILLLTFTNKAASAMMSRVEMLLGRHPQGLWGGTFHSVANRVLRRYAPTINYQQNFSILDEEDSRDLLKLCVKDVGVSQTRERFPQASVLKGIISYSRNARVPIGDALDVKQPRMARFEDTIARIAQTYDERKKRANAMDFDDLLLNWLKILDTDTPHPLAHQFRYVLVDEYQDTNRIQAAIVARLSIVHRNILVVGDDAQSIYSFRAANIDNILKFSEVFPGTKTFRITTNYRSTPEILAVANAVIANNEDQFPKELQPAQRGGSKPIVIATPSAEEEARIIAERILTLRTNGTPLREIAVLFRATHITEFLEMELVKRDIPYDYRGGIRFFERSHIKDALAFLRILANPADEPSWLRVLRLQRGIGDVGAMEIIRRVVVLRGSEATEAIPVMQDVSRTPQWHTANLVLPSRLQAGWSDFQKMASGAIGGLDPAAMLRALAKGPYRDYLESEFENADERLEDIEQLALFAEKYTKLEDFLAETSLTELFGVERNGANASDQERIVLSTIHQAKGLEWDAVFVMGMTSAVFPNRRALTEERGIEEERRLFYVAVTRAKNVLTLSYALTGGGESFLHGPSPFLDEIPARLVTREGAARITPRMRWGDGWGDASDSDEPIIVLDASGERSQETLQQKRGGFLRDVSEL